jgi:glycosyltransferase involved in cell wall biosynthesis
MENVVAPSNDIIKANDLIKGLSPTPPSPSRCVVVVPAFNEVETVGAVVQSIRRSGLDVVVVNDGSTDGTERAAREAGAVVLALPFNLGVGGALRCGFRWAVANGYDTAIQCDADGQHDASELHGLIASAERLDAHLLVGSRFAGASGYKSTWLRRIPMRLLSRVASRAAGTAMTDASSGFRVIREPLLSEFARSYPTHYLGDTFEVLVQAGRHGYRVYEVPSVMRERAGGTASASATASLRYLFRVLMALIIGSSHDYKTFPQDRRGSS